MENVSPCLDCGNTDILISDCGYSSFNTGGGFCKKCTKHNYLSVGTFPSRKELIEIWNSANDPQKIIDKLKAKIDSLKSEIKDIKCKARKIAKIKKKEIK